MPDRLAELVRQRALVQEHLAWLDREIADAAQKSPTSRVEPASSAGVASVPTLAAVPLERGQPDPTKLNKGGTPALPTDAENILAQYRVPPAAVKQDVRKGCFLYFAIAFIFLGLGIALVYLVFSSR